MKSNLVDIEGAIHAETEKAVLFSETGDRAKAVWLPKSMVEIDRDNGKTIATMPEQLALDKGLI